MERRERLERLGWIALTIALILVEIVFVAPLLMSARVAPSTLSLVLVSVLSSLAFGPQFPRDPAAADSLLGSTIGLSVAAMFVPFPLDFVLAVGAWAILFGMVFATGTVWPIWSSVVLRRPKLPP